MTIYIAVLCEAPCANKGFCLLLVVAFVSPWTPCCQHRFSCFVPPVTHGHHDQGLRDTKLRTEAIRCGSHIPLLLVLLRSSCMYIVNFAAQGLYAPASHCLRLNKRRGLWAIWKGDTTFFVTYKIRKCCTAALKVHSSSRPDRSANGAGSWKPPDNRKKALRRPQLILAQWRGLSVASCGYLCDSLWLF
jgi:hypothetical protein